MSSANCFSLDQSKILSSVNGLNAHPSQVMGKPMVGKQMSPYPSADGTEIVRTTDESQLADIKTAVVMLVELFKVSTSLFPVLVRKQRLEVLRKLL